MSSPLRFQSTTLLALSVACATAPLAAQSSPREALARALQAEIELFSEAQRYVFDQQQTVEITDRRGKVASRHRRDLSVLWSDGMRVSELKRENGKPAKERAVEAWRNNQQAIRKQILQGLESGSGGGTRVQAAVILFTDGSAQERFDASLLELQTRRSVEWAPDSGGPWRCASAPTPPRLGLTRTRSGSTGNPGFGRAGTFASAPAARSSPRERSTRWSAPAPMTASG